ncbi:MAG: hypothetical protein PVG04_11570 [Anaerolineales bacterium]
MIDKQAGHYLGTEINESWWRRYSDDGFLARGNGEYWFEEQGLCFLRYLTLQPLFIPYAKVENITTGTWHAGRWNLGRPIVKLHWEQDGIQLSSGFVVGKDQRETEQFIVSLMRRVNRHN